MKLKRRLFRGMLVPLFAALALLAAASSASASETTIELDPDQTSIAFTLSDVLHTVHGTFRLKSGTIHFDPVAGTASGLVIVDVTSGDTGNGGRDRKMHREILESKTYPTATFTPTGIKGQWNPEGASAMQVSGIFRLHGGDHPVTLDVPVHVHGNAVAMSTQMAIPYVAWGLKNPSTFILRVSDHLVLDVNAAGKLISVPAATH